MLESASVPNEQQRSHSQHTCGTSKVGGTEDTTRRDMLEWEGQSFRKARFRGLGKDWNVGI